MTTMTTRTESSSDAPPVEQPAPAFAPPGVDIRLSPEDVRDLGAVLDAAIRSAGYSPVSAAALRLGQVVAIATQRASTSI